MSAEVGGLVQVHQTHLDKTDDGPKIRRGVPVAGIITAAAVDKDGAAVVDVFVPTATYSGLPVVDELADDHEGFAAVPVAGSDALAAELARLTATVDALAKRVAAVEKAAAGKPPTS